MMKERTKFNPYIYLLLILLVYPYGLHLFHQDNLFYLGVTLTIVGTIFLLKKQGLSSVVRFRRFSWKTVVKVILGFLGIFVWAMIVHQLFPLPDNQQVINHQHYVGVELWLDNIYSMLVGPIGEELVFRALLISLLSRLLPTYLSVVISSALFSLGHVLPHTWVLTDFIIYFVIGLIFSLVFKLSKTIYPSIMSHILWNSFVTVVLGS